MTCPSMALAEEEVYDAKSLFLCVHCTPCIVLSFFPMRNSSLPPLSNTPLDLFFF